MMFPTTKTLFGALALPPLLLGLAATFCSAQELGDAVPTEWPDPLVRENNIAGFASWEDIYARMEMSPAWAAETPPDGSWETSGLLEAFLAPGGPMAGVEEIVYSVRSGGSDWHWYANFGYTASDAAYYYYGNPGSELRALNLRTGEERVILEDPDGTIRDPAVHYDGRTILFSYRPGGSHDFDLYTIQSDGTQLTQLTESEYDDIEPAWMPDDAIIFASSRARRWVPCFKSQVAILYRRDTDGTVRPVSCNAETENTPWMLPDGRVLFTRWEYVDRDQNLSYHHLWTMNPDGTGVMTYLGNQFSGMLLIDARPVPGSDKVVASVSPGHGRNEHAGAVALIDARLGPDELAPSRIVSRPETDEPRYGFHNDPHRWRDPWAFSEDCFLVARTDALYVMDGQGRYEKIVEMPEDYPRPANERERTVFMLHEPRPLVPHERKLPQPDRTDPTRATGEMVLADVTMGRNMKGVERGEIKDLLVLEVLPKPINYFGGADIVAGWPTYFLYRVLGTVPVEPDGSAYFEVPALRPVFFVARDEQGLGVKRMRSFTHVMPGETISCVGCHENRTQTPDLPRTLNLTAMTRPPSTITPVPETPEVFHYPRDIQPILDRHCVECHNTEKFAGGFELTGDRGTDYSISYLNLFRLGLVQLRSPVGNHPPRTQGSSASSLLKYLEPRHHEVTLSPDELRKVKTWIDAGAAYAGSYSALGNGMVFYKFPAEEVLNNRCVACHAPDPEKTDLKRLFPNHAFNLTNADKSLMLLAPLAKSAGGLGLCQKRPAYEEPPNNRRYPPARVFTSRDDPDFQALQQNMRKHADWLQNDITSIEFPTFRPSDGYFRELKRFGILPEDFDPDSPDAKITPFVWDERYWQLFHYQPIPGGLSSRPEPGDPAGSSGREPKYH